MHAGRDQVGSALRGAVVRKSGNRVLGNAERAVGFDRAHREQGRVEGRVGEAGGGLAVVAGRDDHRDAGLPGLLGREGEGIVDVALRAVGAEGEVDQADVEAVVVLVLNHPVDAGDHLRHVAGAGHVADLDRDQAGIRGDTQEARGVSGIGTGDGGLVTAGDDARHVGAVAVAVQVGEIPRLGVEGDVRAIDHLARRGQALHRCDPGVDQGDVHPLAGEALGPHRASAGDPGGVVERADVGDGRVGRAERMHRQVRCNRPDVVESGQRREGPARREPSEAVDQDQVPADGAARTDKGVGGGLGAGLIGGGDHDRHQRGAVMCRRRQLGTRCEETHQRCRDEAEPVAGPSREKPVHESLLRVKHGACQSMVLAKAG